MGATESTAPQRVAFVAGGTGLTGAALLQLLLRTNDFSRIHAVTRRPLPLDHPRLANRILQLNELGPRVAGLRCTDAFCCLGAQGGRRASLAELKKVDLDLTISFARAALSVGATRLVVISAANADRASTRPFRRIKGEMEAALRELRFASLDILQPGPVLGVRPQTGMRDMLEMALLPPLGPFQRGKFEASRSITAADLAAAMLGAARSQRRGPHVFSGQGLRALAEAGRRLA